MEILQALEKEVPPKSLAVNGRQVSQGAGGRIFRFKGAEGPNKAPLQPMLSQYASMLPVTQGDSSCVCGKDLDGAAVSLPPRRDNKYELILYSTLAKGVVLRSTERAMASLITTKSGPSFATAAFSKNPRHCSGR